MHNCTSIQKAHRYFFCNKLHIILSIVNINKNLKNVLTKLKIQKSKNRPQKFNIVSSWKSIRVYHQI